MMAFCQSADIVINVSGVNPMQDWWRHTPVRIFIDTDPGFMQIKHLTEQPAYDLVNAHTHHFTFGENIGKSNCSIPDDGFHWRATRQPVYLKAWQPSVGRPAAKWTTVMQWDSYKVREYNSLRYGMKSMSFEKFDTLPRLLPNESFELATALGPVDAERLKSKGWHLINSAAPTQTPWTYQEFISASKGEWSVAKHGYVASNSGWFSERSTCYLASGKPVVVEDTGFSAVFETGKGILPFSTVEEAIDCIERVNKDYNYHCLEARKSAEAFFSADKVLDDMLQQLN
jgi:hypothetical protein